MAMRTQSMRMRPCFLLGSLALACVWLVADSKLHAQEDHLELLKRSHDPIPSQGTEGDSLERVLQNLQQARNNALARQLAEDLAKNQDKLKKTFASEFLESIKKGQDGKL